MGRVRHYSARGQLRHILQLGRLAPCTLKHLKTTNPLLSKGFVRHTARNFGLERPNVYLLQVEWDRLEDDTQGFRGSLQYQEWRRLLHLFYEPAGSRACDLSNCNWARPMVPSALGKGCLGSLLAGR